MYPVTKLLYLLCCCFFCKDLFFNLELTNNSNCKNPQEESVQHHGYILPIFLHFVRILRPPGAINLMGTFDIVKNTLYYLVISAIYLTPSTALISSGQICPSAPWGEANLNDQAFPHFLSFSLSPQICCIRPSEDWRRGCSWSLHGVYNLRSQSSFHYV